MELVSIIKRYQKKVNTKKKKKIYIFNFFNYELIYIVKIIKQINKSIIKLNPTAKNKKNA